MVRPGLCVLIAAASLGVCRGADVPANLPVGEIVTRLEAADAARLRSFPGYVSTRHYTVVNSRFGMTATMKVEVTADAAGKKTFRVIETTGPGTIRRMVLHKMIEAEARASAPEEQAGTRVSGENYTFDLAGVETLNGRQCFVLNIVPRGKNMALMRGKVWVDAEDFAVAKIEGALAKSPSFWLRQTQVSHTYNKHGDFWLAASNHSESQVRMFGVSKTTIVYGDYRLGMAYSAESRSRTERPSGPTR